jgi:hypothetical protein
MPSSGRDSSITAVSASSGAVGSSVEVGALVEGGVVGMAGVATGAAGMRVVARAPKEAKSMDMPPTRIPSVARVMEMTATAVRMPGRR